jgi:membrane-associated protease RseP (regulator of RpoE activity)
VLFRSYLTTQCYIDILRTVGKIGQNEEFSFLWGQTALYTISVMSIIGLHELGHLLACRINHVDASFPIFIPGIPGITLGTFGAVIRQKGPALNRNQLFDIGFTGPFVGFITAMIVSSFGYSLSLPVTRAEFELISARLGPSGFVSLPLAFTLLEPYLMPNPGSFTHFLHPLAFAGWMGTLITFLNAFPIGQFDGGHVARAVLGSRGHRVASYVATIAMFLTGWWSMAILAFFLRFDHPGTLDDVSPLSPNRRALALLFIVIFVACLTISPDSPLALFI